MYLHFELSEFICVLLVIFILRICWKFLVNSESNEYAFNHSLIEELLEQINRRNQNHVPNSEVNLLDNEMIFDLLKRRLVPSESTNMQSSSSSKQLLMCKYEKRKLEKNINIGHNSMMKEENSNLNPNLFGNTQRKTNEELLFEGINKIYKDPAKIDIPIFLKNTFLDENPIYIGMEVRGFGNGENYDGISKVEATELHSCLHITTDKLGQILLQLHLKRPGRIDLPIQDEILNFNNYESLYSYMNNLLENISLIQWTGLSFIQIYDTQIDDKMVKFFVYISGAADYFQGMCLALNNVTVTNENLNRLIHHIQPSSLHLNFGKNTALQIEKFNQKAFSNIDVIKFKNSYHNDCFIDGLNFFKNVLHSPCQMPSNIDESDYHNWEQFYGHNAQDFIRALRVYFLNRGPKEMQAVKELRDFKKKLTNPDINLHLPFPWYTLVKNKLGTEQCKKYKDFQVVKFLNRRTRKSFIGSAALLPTWEPDCSVEYVASMAFSKEKRMPGRIVYLPVNLLQGDNNAEQFLTTLIKHFKASEANDTISYLLFLEFQNKKQIPFPLLFNVETDHVNIIVNGNDEMLRIGRPHYRIASGDTLPENFPTKTFALLLIERCAYDEEIDNLEKMPNILQKFKINVDLSNSQNSMVQLERINTVDIN